MNRYVIAGNWKMNMTKEELYRFSYDLEQNHNDLINQVQKIICVSHPLLSYAKDNLCEYGICVGAQNVSEHEKGAYTGEVSATILHSFHVKYCIIGHSERRQYFGDTDELVKKKWIQLRSAGINPIICVGETLEERESGKTFEVIKRQIESIFKGIELKAGEDMMIAYEPVWAIGTGKTATPEQAQEVHKYIRELLTEIYGKYSTSIPLLYGGSVKPENIKDLLEQDDINGALVGGASLDPKGYAMMIKVASETL